MSHSWDPYYGKDSLSALPGVDGKKLSSSTLTKSSLSKSTHKQRLSSLEAHVVGLQRQMDILQSQHQLMSKSRPLTPSSLSTAKTSRVPSTILGDKAKTKSQPRRSSSSSEDDEALPDESQNHRTSISRNRTALTSLSREHDHLAGVSTGEHKSKILYNKFFGPNIPEQRKVGYKPGPLLTRDNFSNREIPKKEEENKLAANAFNMPKRGIPRSNTPLKSGKGRKQVAKKKQVTKKKTVTSKNKKLPKKKSM